MEKISVIVPVYKVEKYLKKCVDSLLSQTYSPLEVILVDDGSPDACPALCDAYAAKDDRVRVVHKENGGLSDARNAGLEIATGDYIAFVDSDDAVLPDMFERLYTALKEQDADMSICNFRRVGEDGVALQKDEILPVLDETLTGEQAIEKLFAPRGEYYVVAVNRLYKRTVLDGLRFPKGRIHEDEFLAHHVLARCSRIACISLAGYLYLQREGSIMGEQFSLRRLDAGLAMLDRYDFFCEHYPHLTKAQAMRVYEFAYVAVKKAAYTTLPAAYQEMVKSALRILWKERNLRFFKLLLSKMSSR